MTGTAAAFREPKTSALARVLRGLGHGHPERILVVGCGEGLEAAVLGQEFRAAVVGIDLRDDFAPAAAQAVELRQGDATRLEFASGTFDLVYCFHALEHIPDFRRALAEMNRVLCASGVCCVGTPNRSRLIGYCGSKDATWRQRVWWNVIDWRARLAGRFRNEDGAHAGFSAAELRGAVGEAFRSVWDVTPRYYTEVYPRWADVVRLLDRTGLRHVVFPSVYFVGQK
jgi:SAM-dependent methyltransferase